MVIADAGRIGQRGAGACRLHTRESREVGVGTGAGLDDRGAGGGKMPCGDPQTKIAFDGTNDQHIQRRIVEGVPPVRQDTPGRRNLARGRRMVREGGGTCKTGGWKSGPAVQPASIAKATIPHILGCISG